MQTFPDWLNATLASDAADGRGVMPDWIRALWPGCRVVGPAYVVLASQDDNLAVQQGMAAGFPPGCVLVVSGLSTSRTATIGDIMAHELRSAGVAGLVSDGLVRDSRELANMRFPVWCRGATPRAPGKNGPGVIGQPVSLGGITVHPGDIIVGDDDGIVVWPQADVAGLLERAKARLESDNARLDKIRARSGGIPA